MSWPFEVKGLTRIGEICETQHQSVIESRNAWCKVLKLAGDLALRLHLHADEKLVVYYDCLYDRVNDVAETCTQDESLAAMH